MTERKGLGKGKGKGYKNIIPTDPGVHSKSAKGIKTNVLSPRLRNRVSKDPKLTKMSFEKLQKKGVFLKYQGDADKDGVINIKDCKPLNPDEHIDVGEIVEKGKEIGIKTGQAIGKVAKKGFELGKAGLEKAQEFAKERKKEKAEELLKDIQHPKITKLMRQKERVQELEKQISQTDDIERERRLFDELGEEQRQLRDIQEEITEFEVRDLNDSELRTLAIRWQPDEGIFSFFGTGSNPYKTELLRRIRERELLKEDERLELKYAREEAKEPRGLF